MSTGVKAHPKNRRACNLAKSYILGKVRIIEKDLQFEAMALVKRTGYSLHDQKYYQKNYIKYIKYRFALIIHIYITCKTSFIT